MKEIAKTALIAVGTLAFAGILLEIFLNETQKITTNNLVLRSWNVLDELKKRRLLDWVQAWRRWIVSIGVLLAAAFVLWSEFQIFLQSGKFGFADIILSCLIFGPGLWFGFTIAEWTLRATTLFLAVVRATFFIAFAFVPLYLLAAIENRWVLPRLPYITVQSLTLSITLVKLLIIIATTVSMFFLFLTIIFWLPVGIPLIFIYVASTVILIAEFVMRRLAEYPKGALVAIALILAGLVTLLKTLV